MDNKKRTFIISEAALLVLSAFFMFALIGYKTISLTLLFIAAVAALYRLFAVMKNKKSAKTLRAALSALLCAGLALFIAAEIPIIRSARTDDDPESPYLLVLGAGVNGTEPSLSLLNRLEAAKDYLDEYPESVAIVSGGQGPGEDISEADCMASWLEENGIAPERIIREEKAVTTSQNISYALDIISLRGDDPEKVLAIVSSEYHLYRAKGMASELGAKPCGVAAKTTKPVLKVNYFIREALAVVCFWTIGA